MTEIVVPSHCDSRGYCLGGTVLSWIDIAAGIAAKKHGVYPAVTRSVDAVHFISPITLQNIVILQASVNRAWKTSMEVGVRVIIEDVLTAKRQYCCHAYLTFVALPQPPLLNLTPQLRTARPALFSGSQNGTNPADQTSEDTSFANSPAARRFSFSLPKSNSNSRQGGSQRSVQLPAIDPVTAVDIERFNMAQRRREQRLQQSKVDLDEEISMLSDIRDQMRNWTISLDQELPRTDYGLPSVTMKSTFAESVQLVLPQHANSLSITFGGQVMKWMEGVAAVSASRFAHVPIVTASDWKTNIYERGILLNGGYAALSELTTSPISPA
ncbi:Acyl-coenzyme A thioesterase 11 [Lunasporangiospora selenospora]|uniref:Acyl-coenzyme A thioesterase 11 n=1 Tax=Lunasporangiospora selenospora TaxID=979761 RepID=A0A9P6KFH7_9FUNG|nr:Acyl-coenzyme A thioesterase 11 [Lunasporangiospora selenospora]